MDYGAYKQAQDLKWNDRLFPGHYLKPGFPLNRPEVLRVEELIEREDCYDIETQNNHNFVIKGPGVVVHNSAIECFADYATTYNPEHNATVWVTSESKKYEDSGNKMLEDIGAEEKVFDHSWTVGAYGDMIVEVEGKPGVGIVNVDDSQHPANISRVDYKGSLIGFFETPFESGTGLQIGHECQLLPPWKYVHFRVLGAKKKRPLYGDPSMVERSVQLMGPETKQTTSKYGTSLLLNALPVYKRMRLTEDSILLARLHRGIEKYVYKIGVMGMPGDAVNSVVDNYVRILKRARALSTDPNDPKYDSRSNPMATVEDLFVPVWGDARNDLVIEKIGGEPNIRWLADLEEMRNQLAAALRCPLALLGAYMKEASGALGSEAISEQDVRFARTARRLQRSLINGYTRLLQIHFAFQGLDPDPDLFEVHMAETSSAEEKRMKEALDKSLDVCTKFMQTVSQAAPNLDRVEVWNYLNRKFIKLNDFDLQDYITEESTQLPPLEGQEGAAVPAAGAELPPMAAGEVAGEEEMTIEDANVPGRTEGEMTVPRVESVAKRRKSSLKEHVIKRNKAGLSTDFLAALPINESVSSMFEPENQWYEDFGKKKAKVIESTVVELVDA
jgi:hypothetical protein